MTRARALKNAIRARAAKTGERYTAARRHVVKNAATAVAPPESPPAAPPVRPAIPAARPPLPDTPVRPDAVGAVSDAACLRKTGHGLAHWFGVLDAFHALAKGHTAAARHLRDTHGVGAWHSQGITVAYERARGGRARNQRADGSYEVSASKVVDAAVRDVVSLLRGAGRAGWASGCEPALIDALALGAAARGAVAVNAKGEARITFPWQASRVELRVTPHGSGRSVVVVTHARLQTADELDAVRAQWRQVLRALATRLKA